MLVRDFEAGDERPLWAVFYGAVHRTAAADYSPEQLSAWVPVEVDPVAWAERMLDMRPLVAVRDDQIVGFADVQISGYIDMFFVSPAAARQGVGSLLMRRIHEVAHNQGTQHLWSNVSITARPFFEHWGFGVEKQQTVLIRGVELVNYRMSKSLVP